MNHVQKRSLLRHAPSVGLIGTLFSPSNHILQSSSVGDEDHTLFFAESFSSTTGSIIEEGQNIHEDLNREDSRNDFSSLNDFERLVDETVEALKGTSSKIAVDGKINRICKDYSCLTTKDAKRHALTYIACNLGTHSEGIRQKAEDLAGCQLE